MQRVVSDGETSDEDSDIPLHCVKKRKSHVSFCYHSNDLAHITSCNLYWYTLQKIISDDESSYDSSSSNRGARNNFGGYMIF